MAATTSAARATGSWSTKNAREGRAHSLKVPSWASLPPKRSGPSKRCGPAVLSEATVIASARATATRVRSAPSAAGRSAPRRPRASLDPAACARYAPPTTRPSVTEPCVLAQTSARPTYAASARLPRAVPGARRWTSRASVVSASKRSDRADERTTRNDAAPATPSAVAASASGPCRRVCAHSATATPPAESPPTICNPSGPSARSAP